LLIAAGLMIKSVVQLKYVRMPFAAENVFTARINLPRVQYPESASCIRFYETLLPRLQALAGVDAATLSDGLPAAGNGAVPVQIEGRAYAENNDYPVVREGIVTPGYFDTFQTKLRQGREFNPADRSTSQPIAIVNETFARTYFPGVDPLGRHLKRGRADSKEPWLTIVGLVPDLMMQGIGNNNQSPAGYYIPISQSDVTNFVSIALRTRANPAGLAPLVRDAVASLDPDLAIFDGLTMDDAIKRQTWFYRVFGTFFAAFGCCALFLAAAGLYGVMSFSVTQRSREMGVRLALGARGSQLVLLVLRRSVIHLAIGLGLGLLLGLLAATPLQPVLYQVNPRDPAVLVTVLAALTVTSLLASLLPARRVTKIDPAAVLAGE
jgi:putative ABC transport system permease protein